MRRLACSARRGADASAAKAEDLSRDRLQAVLGSSHKLKERPRLYKISSWQSAYLLHHGQGLAPYRQAIGFAPGALGLPFQELHFFVQLLHLGTSRFNLRVLHVSVLILLPAAPQHVKTKCLAKKESSFLWFLEHSKVSKLSGKECALALANQPSLVAISAPATASASQTQLKTSQDPS